MQRTLAYVTTFAIVLAATALAVLGQEKAPESGSTPLAPEHARLAVLVGRWDLRVRAREDAEGAWRESKGTAEFRSVFGGRYVLEESKTTLGGMPFEWFGVHAYDTRAKRHVSAWIDNAGTGIDRMDGTFDPVRATLAYAGEVEEPGSASGKARVVWSFRFEGKDAYRLELSSPGKDGRGEAFLTIDATRAK